MYTYQDYQLNLEVEMLNEVLKKHNVTPEIFLQAIFCFVLGTYDKNKFLLNRDGYTDGEPAYKININFSISLEMFISNLNELEYVNAGQKDEIDSLETFSFLYNKTIPDLDEIENPCSLVMLANINNNNMHFRYYYDNSELENNWIKVFNLHYETALLDAIINIKKTLKEITIVSDYEIKTIAHSNQTEHSFSSDKCVHEIIECVAEEIPNKIALEDDDKQITYRELVQKINSLTSFLINEGIGTGDFVAIAAQRGAPLIYSFFAILKSGAAYVPISLKNPTDRTEYILKECGVKLILSTNPSTFSFPDVKLLDISKPGVFEKDVNVSTTVSPSNLAGLIYTSGTTGTPKGILISHNTIVNYCEFNVRKKNLDKNDITIQFTPFTFSAFIYEISTTLICGAKTCLVKEETIADIAEFQKYADEKQVTVLLMPPDYANYITPPPSVRIVETAGSLCQVDTSLKIQEKVLHYNSYGLTEASVPTSWDSSCDEMPQRVPIGKPISNTQAFVIKNGQPCGMYIPGELWVAGLALSNGYFNQPQLNKERFIPNPFGNGIILRTGDIVQWNYNGDLEYLGRNDNQVQIRGMRVELEEVARTILKQENITNSAVISKEDAQGENVLIAFIVSDKEVDTYELKENLKNTLLSYMIPAHIIQIDELPLNANGKVDRKTLSRIPIGRSTPYIAPEGDKEHAIAFMFEEILQLEQIGRNDNFFEFGGNSLRLTRLINLIEMKYGVRLSIKDVFRLPTVAGISRLLEDKNYYEIHASIVKVEDQQFYTMSPAQRRLYMLQEIDDVGTAYNITSGLKLIGKLDMERVKDTFSKLINRHEVLRTVFKTHDGEVIQEVLTDAAALIEYDKDWDIAEVDFQNLLVNFVRPFDLNKAPLMRIKIVETGFEEYILLVDIHHIIADGMSMNILLQEFSDLYNAMNLNNHQLQYKDYSEWIKKRDLSSQAAYWQNLFADGGSVLELITDHPRPQFQSFRGDVVDGYIDNTLKRQLHQFSKDNGATLYMTLLTAAYVLLHKYSKQNDITIGSPISGRTHGETEHMLGMFVNTLAIRGYPSKEKTFKTLLNEVKISCLEAFENQEFAFEELVDKVCKRRDMSRNPLFDVMLGLQNNEKIDYHLEGLTSETIAFEEKTAKFDLTINIWDIGKEYRLEFEYCSDLYNRMTIEYMIIHYVQILRNVVNNANQKIGDMEILSTDEKNMILEEFNGTFSEYPRDKSVVELFQQQVNITPNKVALAMGDKQFTYRQLNEKANGLAHKLVKQGVRPGDFVVTISEKSIELVIGLIAILKAGGIYVPIDTAYPPERINYIIDDCNPKAILLHNTSIKSDKVEIDLADFIEDRQDDLDIDIAPSDLIYVIYTSGTTGKPKGVMVEHGNVVKLVKNVDYVKLDESTRILQTGAISFDASTFELWGAFLNGGQVVLGDKETLVNPKLLKEAIDKFKINTMFITTALFNQMISIDSSVFCKLNNLLFGGEKTSELHVRKFINCADNNNVAFSNIYGPTESTTFSLFFPIDGNYLNEKTPIGKPISNTNSYVFEGSTLCPIGVPGELCIGGDGVSRGYLNHPDLTSEKFITNPYTKGRLYRSGDLVRQLPDGNIEYLDRIDDQVKIRGFRIELQEIESILRSLKTVSNAAVIMRNDSTGEPALHAYLTSNEDIDMTYINKELQKQLPGYMIPAFMAQIDILPLNPSGKIDKHALPDIEKRVDTQYVAPKNKTEELIASVFKDILGIKSIGTRDNFFCLGGHSLRATKAANQIEKLTGIRIPLKTFFLHPTAEGLSDFIGTRQEYIPLPKAPKQNCYAMTPDQKRWFLMHLHGGSATNFNIPVGIRFNGKLAFSQIEKAYLMLIQRHEALRTGLKIHSGIPVMFDVPMEDIEPQVTFEKAWDLTETELNQKLDEFDQPFQLDQPPLFRIKLLDVGPDESFLLWDIHHNVCDGASLNILLREFAQIYNGHTLPQQEYQIRDFNNWFNSLDLSTHKTYWESEFADGGTVGTIPTDYPRTKVSTKNGMIYERVDSELRKAVEAFGSKNGLTNYMLLMATGFILLHKYSKQEDIAICSPFNGRLHPDTEKIVGTIINAPIVRAFPAKEKKIIDFLLEVRQKCINTSEHQQYAAAAITENIGAKWELNRHPLFDMVIEYQNNESAEDIDLGGLKAVSARELNPDERAKFDFTLNITTPIDEIDIEFGYCTDLYKEKTVKQMALNFKNILKQIVEHPDIPICDITVSVV